MRSLKTGASLAGSEPLGYLRATTQLSQYDPASLNGMPDFEQARVKSQYASVELADGTNMNALSTIGAIRGNAAVLEARMNNLEQDSLSDDESLNSEVAVLNKINASNVLTLRSIQDSNKLLASLLEQQTIAAKQQREMTAKAINAEIGRQASHVEAYRDERRQQPAKNRFGQTVKGATVNRELECLKCMLDFAMKRKCIAENRRPRSNTSTNFARDRLGGC